VERLGAFRPDICVTGNLFPDGAAVDVVELVSQVCPETKVVMVTGQTDAETMRRALDAGAATSYACMR